LNAADLVDDKTETPPKSSSYLPDMVTAQAHGGLCFSCSMRL